MFEQAKFLHDYITSLPEPMTIEEQGLVSYSNMLDEISIALTEYRLKHDLSQSQLADQLKCNQSLISAYENGERNISIEKLCLLMAAIGKKSSLSFKDFDLEAKRNSEPSAFIPDPAVPENYAFAA